MTLHQKKHLLRFYFREHFYSVSFLDLQLVLKNHFGLSFASNPFNVFERLSLKALERLYSLVESRDGSACVDYDDLLSKYNFYMFGEE